MDAPLVGDVADSLRSRVCSALVAISPIAAAQAYIWLVPHERPRWLDVACGLCITTFVVAVVVRRGRIDPRAFGLAHGPDHRRALLPVAILTGVSVGILLVFGLLTGRLRGGTGLVFALLAYPLWGLLQQALMLGFVYPRMRALAGVRVAPLLTGLLFAAAHAPNPLLMIGGGAMAFGFALIWERAPSLPLVALGHGIIGAVCDKALDVSMRVGAHYFDAP